MNILVTGGLGYIGSHIAVVLFEAGHNPIILDNLSNSRVEVLDRLGKILGVTPLLIMGDVRNQALVEESLKNHKIEAVIHCAGLKAVGESEKEPLRYYDNNVGGTIALLQAMKRCQISTLVFSSSATVYGDPQYLPIDESHPLVPTNAYGRTKLQIEMILKDLATSDAAWRIINLRYFNPVGAHDSGLLGEYPQGIPNNLMPYVAQVATGQLAKLHIFGNDYPTADGTGIRDYIHVVDLAEGHTAALSYMLNTMKCFETINLGTGSGYSVLQMVSAFKEASKKNIPYIFIDRRPGDIGACYASVAKAQQKLNWKASRSLTQMCSSAWKFQHLNDHKKDEFHFD